MSNKDKDEALGSQSFWSIIIAVFFGNFMAVLSTTTINVALPVFMTDFDAELNTVQWMMSGFMLATGIIAPIIGFMGDKLSYKRLYVYALLGFTATSALCTLAWNIQSLIVFRILQGLFSGIIMPTTMTIIYQVIRKDKQALAIGLWSVSAMLAPAFGPTLGGWLTEFFGWQSLFIMNIPVGIIAIVMALRFIPYYRLSRGIKLDVIGFIAVILGTSSLLLTFSEGHNWGWLSWKTITLLIAGILILTYFIKRTLKISNPLLNLHVLKVPRFTYSLIINCIITISLYAGTFLVPIYMQKIQHATTLHTGLVMLPGSLLLAFSSFLVGKYYDRIGPFRLILAGTIIMGYATWELSRMNLLTGVFFITTWLAIRYIGIALCNMPVTNAAMTAIPSAFSGHASSVTNWIRQGSAALSVSIFSSILTARTMTHMEGVDAQAPMAAELALSKSIQEVFIIGIVLVVLAIPFTFMLRKEHKPVSESFLEPTTVSK
ncbi:MDR family MFS transporter [Paenibacillus spongiae]|uniref:Multidrug efflux MFS transporter n=1 Tax=Paenibacillus spongiae TaxID=2909671 RepID=A0ABY5SEL9_9BACL|nr:MDR family MFS transporter [Paenibacillus spongiae]UVI31128.1 multidrug efflux MFS transporter [Paenibacillus spongiae]